MFASIALATRIDRAEMRLTESLVRPLQTGVHEARAFVEMLGGGVAAFAGFGSPMNKMIGVGFEGAPAVERLAEVERLYFERGAPVQAEVATLADPTFATMLSERGYVLRNFENVSGRRIGDGDREVVPPPGIRVDLMHDAEVEAWIDAAITAFQHPEAKGVQAPEMAPREVLESALRPFASAPGFRRYCARIDGALAGVATLRIDDGVAQLCGAATLPPFRRRGVQGALLRRRLGDAAHAGCELAVLTTQPGSSSQENGVRQGFALLYARAILEKTPPA